MMKNLLIHIPHSSTYIPEEYKKTTYLSSFELEKENMFMCDYKVDELLDDKSNAIIFSYSRLFCDVERFKNDDEIMNKYGMGYIYTKTSSGKKMFNPSEKWKKIITTIYDKHHQNLDYAVTSILKKYKECIIIDLHSYSSELVLRLFNYKNVPDICLGIEKDYYKEELVNHFLTYFKENGYSVQINYPYKGSLVPNKYYKKKKEGIISNVINLREKN